jgi:CheY-like chemotaxis protein
MESGHMAVQFQQEDIVAFLRFLFDSFHSYAADKGLRLHFISKLDSFTMDFDPDKTLKIVSNLLSNAIKFTKENGDVYLSVSGQVSQSMNGQGKHSEMLEIQVKDTGIGISESQLPHIFDRFYQADDRPARQAEGTGIGLALTRELVKLLNGAITVKSRLGEGATFTVQLPVTRQAPPMETPSSIGEQISGFTADRHSRAPEATTGLGIEKDIPLLLIVEDNEDVVHYLRACLEKDYRLEVARNGREGIDKALEIIPDLIISDIMMPEVDGYTLCQTLKEDGRSNHIPIILLTAKADHVSKITGLQKGADAYLAKPFNREELLVRLQQLIELRRKLQTKYDSGTFTVEAATQQEDEFVVKFRQLILERLDDDGFGIPQLSRALGINRAHLHRKIKALTGKTAAHFIRHIRLQEARQLLLNSDLNISEIAYAVGFKDPAYFSRVFTETFEESPSTVRRK